MKQTLTLAALAVMCSCAAPQQPSFDMATVESDSVSVVWIKDKPGKLLQPVSLFGDVPDTLLTKLNLNGGVPSSVSCFLMYVEGQPVLFDAGLGMEQSQLRGLLAKCGISADNVQTICLTHLHADHIGGLLHSDSVVFSNAVVYLNRVEYDAWMQMPAEQTQLQRRVLEAYANNLKLFNIGDTLPFGIVPIDAYGHTPGHTAYQKNKVIIIGDLIHGADLQLPYPDYCAAFDMDKTKAVESRKRIVDYARQNGLLMAGMHLPELGFISFSNDVVANTGNK